jgi:hypothetical protein
MHSAHAFSDGGRRATLTLRVIWSLALMCLYIGNFVKKISTPGSKQGRRIFCFIGL